MKRLIVFFGLSLILQSCLVSRCFQPKTKGFVYDYDSKKPIVGCSVNGLLTDSIGYYEFEEIRYREFTFIGFEARPVIVNLYFSKEGYKADTISAQNPYGGSMGKGAHWDMDTLFLKRL